MRTTAYIRKKGNYYHLVFEWTKNGKKHSKSRTSGSSDEETAKKMLDEYILEMLKIYNLKKEEKTSPRKQLLKEINEKVNLYDNEVTFCNFIYGYVKMRNKTITENTYSGYIKIMYNSLLPYFLKENKKLKEITVFDIEKYYFHELNVRKISPNTINKYHNLLGLVFKQALKFGLINNNPMFIVNKPKLEKYIATTYNSEEIKNLITLLRKKPEDRILSYAVILAAYLGLRREEILGLKWDSIDYLNNTITIKSIVTETFLDGKTIMIKRDSTKTSNADIRSFIIPNAVKKVIEEIKINIEKNKEILGKGYSTKDSEYLFVNELGLLIRPNYITSKFIKFIKTNKLKKIRFHDLRHSCAVLLLESQANIKEVQAYLGHSSAKTTLDTYLHIINRNNIKAVSKISKILD